MPNSPLLLGTMLTLNMGDLICLPPTLYSLPLHLMPHTFTMQRVAACPQSADLQWAAGHHEL